MPKRILANRNIQQKANDTSKKLLGRPPTLISDINQAQLTGDLKSLLTERGMHCVKVFISNVKCGDNVVYYKNKIIMIDRAIIIIFFYCMLLLL